jgi:hypothetical protein
MSRTKWGKSLLGRKAPTHVQLKHIRRCAVCYRNTDYTHDEYCDTLLILRDPGQCHRDAIWFRQWDKLLRKAWMQALYESYVHQTTNFHNWNCPNKTEPSQIILLWPSLPVTLLEERTSLSGRLFFNDGIFRMETTWKLHGCSHFTQHSVEIISMFYERGCAHRLPWSSLYTG